MNHSKQLETTYEYHMSFCIHDACIVNQIWSSERFVENKMLTRSTCIALETGWVFIETTANLKDVEMTSLICMSVMINSINSSNAKDTRQFFYPLKVILMNTSPRWTLNNPSAMEINRILSSVYIENRDRRSCIFNLLRSVELASHSAHTAYSRMHCSIIRSIDTKV